MKQYGVVLFHTTSAVMQAEKMMIKAGLNIKLIPTPREFSSDCGLALRFDWTNGESVKSILENGKVEFDSIRTLNVRDN
jgi:hypothetical protein